MGLESKNNQGPLFTGRTAEIYQWQPGKFIKLYNKGYLLEDVEKEIIGTGYAKDAGMNVPGVDPKARTFKFRFGLIVDELKGKPLKEWIFDSPWNLTSYYTVMAEQQVKMHSLAVDNDLLSQRESLLGTFENAKCFTAEQVSKLRALLLCQPDDNKLCHGDMHPENLIYDGENTAVIDWCDAQKGNYLGDLANTSLILQYFWRKDHRYNPLFDLFFWYGAHYYLKIYQQIANSKPDQMDFKAWRCMIAAFRCETCCEQQREVDFLQKFVTRELSVLSKHFDI